MIIYSLTTLNFKAQFYDGKGWNIDWREWKDSCVGFFSSLEKAQECVNNNWGSLDECGYYKYLVIQRQVEGLYNIKGTDVDTPYEWWYSFDIDKNGWVPCEKPEALMSMINF